MSGKLAGDIRGRQQAPRREPTRLAPDQSDLGVASADPVDEKNELVCLRVEIGRDLLNQQPDQTLSRTGISSGRVPDGRRRIAVMNGYTALGIPVTEAVG